MADGDLLRAAPLDDRHLAVVSIIPETHDHLEDAGYELADVTDWLVINDKQDDDPSGYVVQRCELFDTVEEEDAGVIWTCPCSDYHHRQFPWDVDVDADPADADRCKHIEKVQRVSKADRAADEDQQTLGGGE